MSRYYGHLVVTFTDGTTERVGGNRHEVREGVLSVWTDASYGGMRDRRWFPLSGVRSYRWEDE